jgi:GT2 family glycosyltransferase
MEDNTHYACVEHWNESEFLKNGHFKFIQQSDIEYRRNKLIDVNYVGFGFILIKHGVFESLTYPHFRPNSYKIGNTVEFAMEDVSWCHNVKAAGYQILVDPSVIVGHEKTMVLL